MCCSFCVLLYCYEGFILFYDIQLIVYLLSLILSGHVVTGDIIIIIRVVFVFIPVKYLEIV